MSASEKDCRELASTLSSALTTIEVLLAMIETGDQHEATRRLAAKLVAEGRAELERKGLR